MENWIGYLITYLFIGVLIFFYIADWYKITKSYHTKKILHFSGDFLLSIIVNAVIWPLNLKVLLEQ